MSCTHVFAHECANAPWDRSYGCHRWVMWAALSFAFPWGWPQCTLPSEGCDRPGAQNPASTECHQPFHFPWLFTKAKYTYARTRFSSESSSTDFHIVNTPQPAPRSRLRTFSAFEACLSHLSQRHPDPWSVLFISCLFVVARTPNTTLNNSDCLVLDLRGKLLVFHCWVY